MRLRLFRILIILAGVMGADGVILAAMAAHQADATRLGAASSTLLFHATAVLAVVALAERGVIHFGIGIAAALGFVAAAGAVRRRSDVAAICRPYPVPDGSADRGNAADRELARARGGGRMAAARLLRASGHALRHAP